MTFYVYLHRKATTGAVFYVGKGFGDRSHAVNNRNRHWHNVVKKHGLKVEFVQIDVQEWYAHELERELIALYGRRNLGLGPLVNLTDGGEGVSGLVTSAEARFKQSTMAKQRWSSLENRERQRDTVKATWEDKDHREKMTEIARLKAKDPVFLEKQRAAKIGRKSSEELKARLSEGLKARWANPAFKEMMREKLKASAANNPEFRKKLKDSQTARMADPAYRANAVAAMQTGFAKLTPEQKRAVIDLALAARGVTRKGSGSDAAP